MQTRLIESDCYGNMTERPCHSLDDGSNVPRGQAVLWSRGASDRVDVLVRCNGGVAVT
jgi:hypothetical protein